MKKLVLFLFLAFTALTAGAQETVTDVISVADVSGLSTSAALANYTGASGIEYGIRCRLSDDGTAFHYNANANGYQMWNATSVGYVRTITFVAGSGSAGGTLAIYGYDDEWTLNNSGYPNTPTSEGKQIATATLTAGQTVTATITGDYRFFDICSGAAAAEFTSITIEWEIAAEEAPAFKSIEPESGSEISRKDNTFVLTFTNKAKVDAEASYIIPAQAGSGYVAFESIEPQTSGAEYSRAWTLTVPQTMLEEWPMESAGVTFRFVIYAYAQDGTEVVFDDDGSTAYVAEYIVLDDSTVEIIKPDVTTDPVDGAMLSVLRTFSVSCEEGMTMSNYSYEDENGNYQYVNEGGIEIRDASGAKVTGVTENYDYIDETDIGAAYNGLGVRFTLSQAIKTQGDYTIYIPEYMFVLGAEKDNWEANVYSDEIIVSFSIDGTEEGQLDYTLSPHNGETVAEIRQVAVTFDGRAEWNNGVDVSAVRLYDSTGATKVTSAASYNTTSNGSASTTITFTMSDVTDTTGAYIFSLPANSINYTDTGKSNKDDITATINVLAGVLSTGEVIIYNKVAYMVTEEVPYVGVLNQADYAGYEGVDTTGEIVIPATIEHDNVPYTVSAMAARAFAENTAITSVDISANITDWGFRGESGVTGSTFYGCTNLTTVTLSNMTSLAESMFYDCPISEITIPEGVREITGGCFACLDIVSKLETIYLPSTTTSLGGRTFSSCKALRDIYCYAVVPPTTVTENSPTFNGCTTDVITLHVPCQSIEDYEDSEYWGAQTYNYINEVVGYDCEEYIAHNITFTPAEGTVESLSTLTMACEGGMSLFKDSSTAFDDIAIYSDDAPTAYVLYWDAASDASATIDTNGNYTSITAKIKDTATAADATITANGTYTITFAPGDITFADGTVNEEIILTYTISNEVTPDGDTDDELYKTLCTEIAALTTALADAWQEVQDEHGAAVEELTADYEAIVDAIAALQTEVDDDYAAGTLADNEEEIETQRAEIEAAIAALLAKAEELVPSGIGKIEADTARGAIYTLTGQKVSAPTAKGIYIINGKRVLVR